MNEPKQKNLSHKFVSQSITSGKEKVEKRNKQIKNLEAFSYVFFKLSIGVSIFKRTVCMHTATFG